MRIDNAENDSTYNWRRDSWLGTCAFTALLLVVSAATPHAAGFDTFLRTFVFCFALVRGFAGFRRGGAWLPLSAALIAVLFNPLRPIGMTTLGWTWCDLIAAAWFAIVGAWRLLRSWEPQRGWVVAAVSLGALAVPAVTALSAPNRDSLKGMNLDENVAVTNADANAAAAPPEANAAKLNAAGPEAAAKPVEQASSVDSPRRTASAPENASTGEVVNRAKAERAEVSATPVTPGPPLANRTAASPANAPADIEPLNNESDGNQDTGERRLNRP